MDSVVAMKTVAVLAPLAIPAYFFAFLTRNRCWNAGLGLGLLVAVPLAFLGPFINPVARNVIETVACAPGATLEERASGRGAALECVSPSGTETVHAWSALISFDMHFPIATVVGVIACALLQRKPRPQST